MRSSEPSCSARAAISASSPRSPARPISATANSTPASSTAILTNSAPRRSRLIAPPWPWARKSSCSASAPASPRHANAKRTQAPASPWDAADAFQLAGGRTLALPLIAEGESVVAEVAYGAQGAEVTVEGARPAADAFVIVAADAAFVLHRGRQTKVSLRDLALDEAFDQARSGLVRAPMHGKVLAVLVEQGARVARGQRLAIIEAMKMEHTLVAPLDGVVAEIAVAPDAQVAEGAKVMLIEPAAAPPKA